MTILATILAIVFVVAAIMNIVSYLLNVADAMSAGITNRTVVMNNAPVRKLEKAYAAR